MSFHTTHTEACYTSVAGLLAIVSVGLAGRRAGHGDTFGWPTMACCNDKESIKKCDGPPLGGE